MSNRPTMSSSNVATIKALVSSQTLFSLNNDKSDLTMTQPTKGSSLKQVAAAVFANLGNVNTGMVFGFSAAATSQLISRDSPYRITSDESTWIASLSAIGTMVGCVLGGYMMDLVGRKMTLIITEVPTILGWALIALAPSLPSSILPWIFTGRILTGLGSGMVGAPSRIYTAECSQPHLRGMLSSLASFGVSLGVLFEYSLGAFLSWDTVAAISTIIPVLSIIAGCLMPESPSWLLSQGRKDACRNSLRRLRANNYDVEKEVQGLYEFSKRQETQKSRNFKETLAAIVEPACLKPFVILMLYFLIYQFSGVNPVTFYAVNIFKDAGAHVNNNLAAVIMGIVRLIFTIASCIMMKKMGRRSLTFISSIGCGVSMTGLGLYIFATKDFWPEYKFPAFVSYLPVLMLMTFTAASTIGYLVVPWVMIGEVYPTKVRGIVGGLTTCACHFFIFLTVKSYNMFQTHLTKEGTFLMYGCISLLGTIFFYVYLPETKNKTLQEIEEQFAGKSKKHHSEIYVKPSQQKLILSSDDLITSEKPKAINGSAVAV
ncbi:hypothetical protein M8J76_005867 [Diaphorina citri]|nr:hypothetical protein M8J75_005335 [Diaphorina citri]KAI5749247.1 hypothetical protein M8J76_005867 [Diaphorina citri]KAI5753681.1 hypothetical protein M8J77_002448 [Diaphorina citri]